MLFSSTIFIYFFLPAVVILYYTVLRRSRTAQNVFLFIASLLFYAWGEPKFVFIMMLSIFMNWLFALLMDSAKKKGRAMVAKAMIATDCMFNLALLLIFKYLGFASSFISSLGIDVPVFSVALPIGISFFTFQAMSYVIDVYRNHGEVQKNILNVGLYVAFFPQLIAGPIVRYETVAWEIKHRQETPEDFFSGFSRFIVGLGKKVMLANAFAILADKSFLANASGGISASMAWLGAIAYTLQIFFDFCGYSDMAIGLGKMFGFHFLENFDYPYISKSITEFWRRWHISLGTWFRDYVYIPLGGSRVKSKGRLIFNLFAVWSLTGIWHGAEWTFLIWGLMYFALLVFEKLTGFNNAKGKAVNIFKRIYTLFFVVIGWVLFRAENTAAAISYIKAMFSPSGTADAVFTGYLSQNAVMLAIGILLCTPVAKKISDRFSSLAVYGVIRWVGLTVLFVICLASLISSSYNPFIYFNF